MIGGILNLLVNTTAISNIVGARVYINKAPQKAALPYLILTQLGSEEYLSIDSTTSNLRGLVVDVDCKARTFPDVQTLAEAVKARLTDYSGAAGTYTVRAAIFNDETHDYEPSADGSDNGAHVITLDYDFQYSP